jgi:sulfide:quinone oxidoreductase
MTSTSSAATPAHVVVAGGGVGALEAVLALRALAGDRVTLELVAPEMEFVERPLAVAAPFEAATPERLPLARLEATHGVRHRRDRLVGVNASRRLVRLADGGDVPYDVLVVATGAHAEPWLEGALTFRGPSDVAAYRELLTALEDGTAGHVLYAVPPRASWTLPLYELALLTTAWIAEHGVTGARLTLATPDPEPLSIFGASASRAVRDLLGDRGVELVVGRPVVPDANGMIDLGRLGRLRPDRIVTLPKLVGRAATGLPTGADGFIPVDDHAAVRGLEDVYAVGDISAVSIKQGGLAAQQADAAAALIAARLGAHVRPEPFTPVLRGLLLTGVTSAFLREGGASRSRVGYATSWSADLKVAARHLSAYLAASERTEPDLAALRRQAVEFAHADARWGDLHSALSWLEVVEVIDGELDDALTRRRDEWQRELAGRGAYEAPGAPAHR